MKEWATCSHLMNHALLREPLEPGKFPNYVTPRSSLLVTFPCLLPAIAIGSFIFKAIEALFPLYNSTIDGDSHTLASWWPHTDSSR